MFLEVDCFSRRVRLIQPFGGVIKISGFVAAARVMSAV